MNYEIKNLNIDWCEIGNTLQDAYASLTQKKMKRSCDLRKADTQRTINK